MKSEAQMALSDTSQIAAIDAAIRCIIYNLSLRPSERDVLVQQLQHIRERISKAAIAKREEIEREATRK